MTKTLPAAVVTAGLILSGWLPVAAKAADYSGRWAVDLRTDSGPCDASYSYAIAISGGQVRLVSGDDGARVSGQVGSDGRIGLQVAKGSASGSGTGRLDTGKGSGTWTVSALCSGRWTARRSEGRAALAD